EFTAELQAESDSDTANNRYQKTFAVQAPLQVLYIGDRMTGGAERLSTLLGRGFSLHSADNNTLGAGFDFSPYDLVLIDDAPARQLDQGFQQSLQRAVEQEGLGLLFTGGEASFGGGGYDRTPVAELLPVSLKQ